MDKKRCYDRAIRQTSHNNKMIFANTCFLDGAALGKDNWDVVELRSAQIMHKALDVFDSQTSGHSAGVANLMIAFATYLCLDGKERHELYEAGLIHDIGKVIIPKAILNKPEKLTYYEYEVIKQHTVAGAKIISQIATLAHLAVYVRHHHERYDGTGYPDGLSGQSLPFGSRILALCDAFEAMTATRVYGVRMSPADAVEEIRRYRGKQFDPELADEFIAYYYETAENIFETQIAK